MHNMQLPFWRKATLRLLCAVRSAILASNDALELHKSSSLIRRIVPSKDLENTIDILNFNFFDANGEVLYKGGAERYIVDLGRLLWKRGLKCRIIQDSNFCFEKNFDGLPVIGIPARAAWNPKKLYSHYLLQFKPAPRCICSPLEIPCLSSNIRTLGINHGVHWDAPTNHWSLFRKSRYSEIFSAIANIDLGVCVDTNFINWVRTCDHKSASKLRYIPNYFNNNYFPYKEKRFDQSEIVILYPRRLYEARGFYLVLQMIDTILPKFPNVSMHFVGQADPIESNIVKEYICKYGPRIKWYELEMNEMSTAYQKSQIVVIPTVCSEGTSLSCIEAMATNNSIVSTNIGGLPNLIIDKFNGYLIDPSAASLISAVSSLLENPLERSRIAKNAFEVSHSFTKDYWDLRWEGVLDAFVNL